MTPVEDSGEESQTTRRPETGYSTWRPRARPDSDSCSTRRTVLFGNRRIEIDRGIRIFLVSTAGALKKFPEPVTRSTVSPCRKAAATPHGLITLTTIAFLLDYVEKVMNLVIILVPSLFVQQCNSYQLPTLRRFGPPASSIFAINHQTPSFPGWLTRLRVNNLRCPSHSPWRLFSTADKKGGNDLTLPSLDFSSNQTAFDFANKVYYYGNKRAGSIIR